MHFRVLLIVGAYGEEKYSGRDSVIQFCGQHGTSLSQLNFCRNLILTVLGWHSSRGSAKTASIPKIQRSFANDEKSAYTRG
jgi:hypothetical protein